MAVALDPTPPSLAPPSPVQWHPATVIAPAAAVLLAAGLVVASHDGLSPTEVLRSVVVVAWAIAGAALVTRPPLRTIGVVVLAGVAVAAAGCLSSAVAGRGWGGLTDDLAELARPLSIAAVPAVGLHLLLAFPHGRLGRSRRTGAMIGYGVAVALGLALWVGRPSLPTWPIWAEAVAFALAGGPAANRRYVRTAGLDRQRLQWLGCAVAVVAEVVIVVVALRALVGWPAHSGLVAGAATLLVPAALTAGTSSRLVTRVDRLLVHTVSVTGLTGVVVLSYLVIVLGLGRVPGDAERRLLILSMAAAAVAAAAYVPARQRLSEVANRLVYGEREAPDAVLATFGSRLSRAIPMDELLLQLAESLRKTMTLDAAEVWTGTGGRLERVVSVPDQGPAQLSLGPTEHPIVARAGVCGNAWVAMWLPSVLDGRSGAQLRVAPATHSGELQGLIVAQRAGTGDAFLEEEERVLTELARQVGVALHNVELDSALQASLEEVQHHAEELRASRLRIVATADAERRKIERNLHDGAQQHLVALAVNVRLARDFVKDDPATATAMLDELAASIKETIQELRDLAHGIYPPLLMDSGLPAALLAAAGRSPLDVEVRAPGVGRYPTEVEAAVYFCCLEALQNAAKHAPRSHVLVQVGEEAGRLAFEVSDDGPGFDLGAKGRGHGFVNMDDRLGAIGGTVAWHSAPGDGTRVSGSVPLAR